MSSIQAGLVQMAGSADKTQTMGCIEQQLENLAKQGCQLVLLQELHNSLYFCQSQQLQHFDLAEPLDGPSVRHLAKLAKQLGLVIVGSIFERRLPGVYHNTAVVLDNARGLVGYYRKMHIPDDPGFQEKFYFTPGDAHTPGFQPIDTQVGRLGVLVCWDQWYPEAARLMALAGAQLLLYPTAIGWDPRDDEAEQQRQLDAWQCIQRAHGVANHLPVLVANRCGFEPAPTGEANNPIASSNEPSQPPGIDFWGHSFICGPQGEYLAQLDKEAGTLQAHIDLDRTEQLRQIWPYLRDRRVDAYGSLSNRVADNNPFKTNQ